MRLTERRIAIHVQPADPSAAEFVASMLQRDDVVEDGNELVMALDQVERDRGPVDAEDRIAKGAKVLKEMVAAGL